MINNISILWFKVYIFWGEKMKYVLLDTNIVIDMVIDRRHQVTDAILSSFIKLLDYDEIKLIVPEIVKIETQRHLEEELALVGKQINKVMKNIDDLYGVATYTINGLNIQDYKKKSKQELAKAYDMYQQNEVKYEADLKKTIEMVFNHKNSIIIACDDFLSNAVTKRRIYKRAPFHIEQKESYGDGLIAETLINLGRYVSLQTSDEVFFVTGNYIDFCVGRNNKTTLLPDIVDDINKVGILCPVRCINTFGQLIGKELKDNVANANLSEEFENQLQTQQEIELKQSIMDIWNTDRAIADLTPMDGYDDKVENDFIDSDFVNNVKAIFQELNDTFSILEDEGYYSVYEELSNILEGSTISSLEEILCKFKSVFDKSDDLPNIGGVSVANFTVQDTAIVLEWLNEQRTLINSIDSIERLPDSISFGDVIGIMNSEFKLLRFSIDGLFLGPEEGSSEDIEMKICTSTNEEVGIGHISVTYGFIEYDDDGGIGDGISDDISYYCNDIIQVLEEIVDEWKELIKRQSELAEQLIEEFELA